MAKTNMVTRRVVESRNYNVFKVEGETLTKVGETTIKGRPKEEEIAKEFKVDKVVLVETSVNKKVYGVPVEEFMKIAVEVTKEEKDEE